MSVPADPAYVAEIEAWRRWRRERLAAPTGWLTLVGLHWLHDGENAVGAGAEVDLPGAPAAAGTIRVEGSDVTWEPTPGARVTADGLLASSRRLDVEDAGPGTVLALGTLRFHVMRRVGRLAVRVRDLASPAHAAFRGIPCYPIDPRLRVEAVLVADEAHPTLAVPTVLGIVEEMTHPGTLRFELLGRACRLDAVQEPDASDLMIVFGDATNGERTYGGGRYLRAPLPGPDGRTVLDCNRAYNPPCVFTPYATCPTPRSENRLPFPVEGGEMLWMPGSVP